jgi:hypothetical protein
MIEVIDNLLTPSYCDSIYNLARNHLSYQYTINTSWEDSKKPVYIKHDQNVKDIGQFCCPVYDCDIPKLPYSWAYEQLKPIFYTVKDMFPEYNLDGSSRVKFNLLLKNEFGDHYNQPHVDAEIKTYAMVYYLNDSDGDTVIFNEKFDINMRDIELTEHTRIQPKKNRAVIFESDRFHASMNPAVSRDRFVLNWVFWRNNNE